MDDENENQNSTNTESEKDTLNQTTNDDDEFLGENESELENLSQEALLALIQKEKASKQKIYARMKKAEEKLKTLKPSDEKVEVKKTKSEPDNDWKSKMEFAIKHRDLDADQIDYISAFAKGKGVSLEDALKDKLVAKAIEEDKDEKRTAKAIPRGKSLSPTYEDFHDKLSKPTSREEHKKLWKEAIEKAKIKGVQAE